MKRQTRSPFCIVPAPSCFRSWRRWMVLDPLVGWGLTEQKAVICIALALMQLISWLRLKSSVFAQSPGWKVVRSGPFLLWWYGNWGLVSIYAKHPKTYGFVPFSARWRTSSPLPLPSLQTQKKKTLKGSMVFTIKIQQPPLADRIYGGKVVVIWSNINPGWPP